MTRFARAKGSKSSNEKAPEDSTPWEVMKEQLMQSKKVGEESQKREEAEKQRIENYEKFLKDHKTQKRTATWCDFPETQTTITANQTSEPVKKKNKTESTTQPEDISSETKQSKKKSKAKTKLINVNATTDAGTQSNDVNESNKNNEDKKRKKKNKQNTDHTEEAEGKIETEVSQPGDKKKKLKKDKPSESPGQSENNQQGSNMKQNERQNKQNARPNNQNERPNNQNARPNNQNERPNNQKPPKQKKKLVNGEPARRKPVNDSFHLIINGKEVELVRYDGFPIMKKDAERLEELKTSMIKKGIPKSEVQRTMKLERRRAEKALARVKRDVCYNCRKGGHNLSDCPDLKSKIPNVGAPNDGLCFKCGSTEHRQFECKVQKDKEFRFATCFICKEPGHIARQCPDNPKGLYPNGGSCNLCGDVTHMRKDCPTVQDKREDSSIKLQTLDSAELEGIPQTIKNTVAGEPAKKPKKIMF